MALEGPHLLMFSFVRIFLRWPCGCPLAVTTGVPTGGGQWSAHGGTTHDIEIIILEHIKKCSTKEINKNILTMGTIKKNPLGVAIGVPQQGDR